jgi:hypothetical protein
MDELARLRDELEEVEVRLASEPYVALRPQVRDGRSTHVVISRRFHRLVRRARIWRSSALLTTLKNAGYGFDPTHARSVGGRDGIFLIDRTVAGPMTRKLYDRYLDRADSGAPELASYLGAPLDQLQAVRLVSHHLRLLGVLCRKATEDWLALVDFDRRER